MSQSLIASLRAATQPLHARAERSGIIRHVLRGTASRTGYAMLLRTLLPVYQALEAELQRHNGRPLLAGIGRPELYRSSAIEMDLSVLAGPDWAEFLPTLPARLDYAARVTAAAEANAGLLSAPAYTRFLGDLSGGLIMARGLSLSLQLQPDALRFFEFPDIVDVRA